MKLFDFRGCNCELFARKPVVLLINNCLYLVTYVVGAGVVAIWR